VLLVLAILLAIFVLPRPWGIAAVVVAGVLEVAESWAYVWWSRRRKAHVGIETLVGRTAVAMSAVQASGQVRVDGEIWRAQSETSISPGDEVVVRGVAGLTLLVEPAAK
jgi:membrane protein implicated in regulation of membrane protease activity